MAGDLMVEDTEVERINIEEIEAKKRKLYIEDQKRLQAVKELTYLIKEIGLSGAYRVSGYVTLIRRYSTDYISENLYNFIRSCSLFRLRGLIKDIFIASYEGSYSSFSLREDWNRTGKGFFWYYWYSDKNFVNIYTLPFEKIPLYVNHPFKDEKDREYLIKKLKGIN